MPINCLSDVTVQERSFHNYAHKAHSKRHGFHCLISRKLFKCHTITLTQICALVILGRSLNSFYFSTFHCSYWWRNEARLKVSWMVKCSIENMSLYKIPSFFSRTMPTVKENEAVSRTVNFTRDVHDFVSGGVTEYRNSIIIPDWHQLDSEVFTAAMPTSASDSWDRRICDVCSLGHQLSVTIYWGERLILQLQSPLPVLLRSQQSLKPL